MDTAAGLGAVCLALLVLPMVMLALQHWLSASLGLHDSQLLGVTGLLALFIAALVGLVGYERRRLRQGAHRESGRGR